MPIRFGEFVFDPERRELLKDGEERRLSTKAFLLLELLLSNAPRAMTKAELYRHVWGDTFVEEANLPNLISEIRSALDETRQSARFIKTIHGYGYAFSGETRTDSPSPPRGGHLFSLQWRRDEFPLKHGENIVGRSGADVVIDSGAVSRRHARITVSTDGATIEDLGSKNGTFVGESRVSAAPVPLRDGDEVRLGLVSLVFRSSARDGSTFTEMTP